MLESIIENIQELKIYGGLDGFMGQRDKVVDELGRDRSYVLNQTIEAYLEIYSWQVAHIEEGQKQARNGDFVPEQEWRSAFNRNR